jgi:steroid delta-isomerase
MPDAAQIRAAVDAYTELFSAGDRAAWLRLWASDATMEDPVGTPVKVGHEAIGRFYDESHGLADSIRLVRTGPVRIAAGEAAFPMQARPTIGAGELMVDIIDVMRFVDDETSPHGVVIAEMRAFWDPAETRPAD